MFDYVIYHARCNDGALALNIVVQQFPLIKIIQGFNEKPLDRDAFKSIIPMFERSVIFVDICPAKDEIEFLKGFKRVVIIDHHKTNVDTLEYAKECGIETIFDLERSACQLVSDYFELDRTWVVDYVGDRDIWRFDREYCHEVNASLWKEGVMFNVEQKLVNDRQPTDLSEQIFDEHKEKGKYHLKIKNQEIEDDMSHARTGILKTPNGPEYKVWISYTRRNSSEVGNELCKIPIVGELPDFSILLYWDPKNRAQWALSMRSLETFDVSDIAIQFGGGGHKCAASFKCDFVKLSKYLVFTDLHGCGPVNLSSTSYEVEKDETYNKFFKDNEDNQRKMVSYATKTFKCSTHPIMGEVELYATDNTSYFGFMTKKTLYKAIFFPGNNRITIIYRVKGKQLSTTLDYQQFYLKFIL